MMKTIEIRIRLRDTGVRVTLKCCQCGRVKVGPRWEFVESLRDNASICSHGYCPECLAREMAAIDAIEARERKGRCPSPVGRDR